MVVGHNDGNAARLEIANLTLRTSAIVDRDDETDVGDFLQHARHGGRRHAIPFCGPSWNERNGVSSQGLHRPYDDRGRAKAIAIVVPEDHDALVRFDRLENFRRGRCDARQGVCWRKTLPAGREILVR